MKKIFYWLLGLAILGSLVNRNDKNDKQTEEPEKKVEEAKCEKEDLRCRGEKALIHANLMCKKTVEQSASHNFRWVDGTFESKFGYYKWTKKPGGRITLIGDKIEFMNAFGAYFPMVYECDLSDEDNAGISVRVAKGRLQ